LKLKSFLVLEIPPVEILVHFCKKHCAVYYAMPNYIVQTHMRW